MDEQIGKFEIKASAQLNRLPVQFFSTLMSRVKSNSPLQIDERTRTLRNENNLNKDELNQICYWKPKTDGDVVFNFWD